MTLVVADMTAEHFPATSGDPGHCGRTPEYRNLDGIRMRPGGPVSAAGRFSVVSAAEQSGFLTPEADLSGLLHCGWPRQGMASTRDGLDKGAVAKVSRGCGQPAPISSFSGFAVSSGMVSLLEINCSGQLVNFS